MEKHRLKTVLVMSFVIWMTVGIVPAKAQPNQLEYCQRCQLESVPFELRKEVHVPFDSNQYRNISDLGELLRSTFDPTIPMRRPTSLKKREGE